MDRFLSAGVPLYGQFELTGNCNLRCSMCYLEKNAHGCQKEADLTTEEWIRILSQACDAGMLQAVLSGGEPLLHEGFRDIVQVLHAMGVAVVLKTNASLITGELADFLKENPPFCVHVSLYAVSDAVSKQLCKSVGAWRKALAGVDRLLDRGIRVSLRTTLVQDNVGELDLMWEEARRRGLPLVWVDTVLPPFGMAREEIDGIRLTPAQYLDASRRFAALYQRDFPEEQAKWQSARDSCHEYIDNRQSFEAHKEMETGAFVCPASHIAFSIDKGGKMTPCPLMREPSALPLRAGFSQAWKELRRQSLYVPSCKACEACQLSPLCSACPARLKAENNTDGSCAAYLRDLAVIRWSEKIRK